MSRFFSKPLFWIFTILAIFIIAFFYFSVKADYADDIPIERDLPSQVNFNLRSQLKSADFNNIKSSFPYKIYLDSTNLNDILSLSLDLALMDSLSPHNEMLNQETLSIALTEKLEERIKQGFEQYNPDSLIRMIQWAEKFNAYAGIDPAHTTLFQVIYNHWFNFASNTLRTYYETDNSLMYNYKFHYIYDRIKEKQFITPIKATNFEKVINNMLRNKWSYLFNKFWNATGNLYKSVVFFLVLIIIFPYIYILKQYR